MWPAAAERVAQERRVKGLQRNIGDFAIRTSGIPYAKFGKDTEKDYPPWRASEEAIDVSRTSRNPRERLLVPRFRDSL
jgi:hypothetical protein